MENTTTKAKRFNAEVTEGTVSFRNLQINPKTLTFTMEYSVLEGRKRRHIYQSISGNITKELVRWFSNVFYKKVDGEMTDGKTTAFRLWLERKGIEYKPQIIPTLIFTSKNKSENFDDCPLRLTISDAYGATLNLVSPNNKKVVSTVDNLETGEFVNKYGYGEFKYRTKAMFRRLEVFTKL